MTSRFRLLPIALIVACAAASAQAQTSSMGNSSMNRGAERNSMPPYTHDGYFGLSAGRSKYDLSTGPVGMDSDNSDSAWKIYTGGFFHPNWGLEVGYVNAGKARRLGGDTEAHGINLSVVGRAPLSEQFDLFGKVGTTYGRTRTGGFSGLGVQTGKESGFGVSYGLGARWTFNPQWAAVIEWENHRFKFSDGKEDVKMTTLGLQYRF